ncbi:GNAT family N-acetyltransferase [Kribbella sp. NBC_01505]|uniref:GNAT family N-acetyltransferase n=1 Tax=Kribbella sp. NBC_01505 TaxID=2903580 RepID=UPI00386D8D20
MDSPVHLRPLELADIATYADWGSDSRLCLHAGWTVDRPRPAREAHWRRVIEEGSVLRLAAVGGDEVIGYVDLSGSDLDHRELGYVVGPSARWGSGLGTTIAQLGLAHGFTELNLEWIDAEAAELNHASIRILQRLGMTETGESGTDTYLGVPTPTRCFRITRESYLRENPVPEGK